MGGGKGGAEDSITFQIPDWSYNGHSTIAHFWYFKQLAGAGFGGEYKGCPPGMRCPF